MTTPNNVQNEINAVPWTNSRGLVTGATVSGLLTAIVALFALYGSLSGANTWTGSNNFTGTGDVSTLSSTATRGTTAVTNAVRADVHLSVEDFGAVGDCGTTDNTAAINNAVAALRAQTGYASRGELDFGVDKCYMAGSINMTALTNVTVDFHGSTVLTSANGNVSAIDAVQGNAVTIRNLYLTNFNSNVPYNAIQIGRMLNGYSGAGSITLDNVFVDGYFSQSALYDRAAEVSSFIGTSINNRYATGTPYSAIFDGEAAFQAYSNYASTYNPSNPSVQDALYGTSPGMSMNETVWLEGTISSYYGPAIWNGATRALDLIDTYTAAYSHSGTAGPCFIQNTIASYQTSELSIRSHCEGNISSMFQFTGAASQTILGLLYANHYDNLNANGTEFSLGSGVTSVTIRNINYKVYNTLNLGVSAFDAPSSYTLDGIAYAPAGLFNASLNGVISSNGVQLYSGSMSSTVALPSVLNVAGLTSNGGVSSVSSVTGSFLGAPVAPVLAFPPPSSGGAQATASLSTIGYFGGTITFSGTMSGYAVNDVVTFSDGNCGTPISLKVTAVTSGVPTALGSNSVVGSCPLSESTLTSISTTDSGSGTGLKVNGQSLMWRPLTVAVTGSGAGYGTAPTIAISRGTISATVSLGTSILPLGTAGTTGTPIQNLGAFVDGSAPSAVVLTTSGYTVPVNTSLVRFKPIGTVATSTLTLPTAYADGQILNLDLYGYNVTALTFSPSVTGFTNASVWTANTNHVLRWDASGSVWFLEK